MRRAAHNTQCPGFLFHDNSRGFLSPSRVRESTKTKTHESSGAGMGGGGHGTDKDKLQVALFRTKLFTEEISFYICLFFCNVFSSRPPMTFSRLVIQSLFLKKKKEENVF